MNKRITFRHMDHSDAMEEYINKHIQKIERFLKEEPAPIYIDIVVDAAKVHEHSRAEFHLKSQHYDLSAEYEHTGVPTYEAIDHVIDKMYTLLRRKKDKEVEERRTRGRHDEFKKQR